VFPGFDGGGEWGGAAVDPETGVLYVNASDVPWIAAMRDTGGRPTTGPAVYADRCASCHGLDRRGKDRAPSLVEIGTRRTTAQLEEVITRGRGFMPPAYLSPSELRAVVTFLTGHVPTGPSGMLPSSVKRTSPYQFVGYERWRRGDSTGLSVVKPPWGTLSAIDLNTGVYRWRIPLGQHPALTGKADQPSGTEQYGGPIVTAGGVVFIAATMDAKFRAFDRSTGQLLWETRLPAAGYATPSTFAVGGKQYVVIAAGGGKLGTKSGDAYLAFALP
jgi:quinoprotein glucose dehydrogenase